MSMLEDKRRTERTKDILNLISSHLSGRTDCRGVNYVLTINQDNNIIQLEPNILVFPDVHRRKEIDKTSVVKHILVEHVPYLFSEVDSKGNSLISSEWVIPGTYVYQSSYDNKRRKWVRIK